MNTNIKNIGLGILGGIIPLSTYLYFQNPTQTTVPTKSILFDGKKNSWAHTTGVGENFTALTNFTEASKSSLNSVVHVTTKVVKTNFQRDIFSEFFYGPGAGGREFKQYGSGSGSGVIVSSKGYIVTNNHVIKDASEIEVILNDESKYKAKVVGVDPSTDIAVLKIEGENFQSISMGDSDNLEVGEWVLAVGNPFNLTSTVTAGIVSAKARNINLLTDPTNQNIIPIESFIQTDAAVNPGNSGGALVNTKGELVGINTAIASQTGSYAGYSFAIPVNLAQKVISDLIDFGVVQRAFLGVQIADINQELKEKENLPDLKGVYIAKVIENGSADKGGLKDGEVILKIGTKEVNSVSSLQEEIGKRRPGDKVNVTVRDKSKQEKVKELVLRNSDGETELISKAEIQKNMALGAVFEQLTSKEKRELSLDYGVKIKNIATGKLKSEGLDVGMVITKANNEIIRTPEQLTNKLNQEHGVIWLEIITESGQKVFKGFEI